MRLAAGLSPVPLGELQRSSRLPCHNRERGPTSKGKGKGRGRRGKGRKRDSEGGMERRKEREEKGG